MTPRLSARSRPGWPRTTSRSARSKISSATYLEHPSQTDRSKTAAAVAEPAENPLAEVEELLSEQLATRVTIQSAKKRGKIVIEFGSADDLDRIVSEIIGSGPGLAPDEHF